MVIGDFFAEDGIGIAEDGQFFFGDFTHDADSQARSRERLAPYEVFWQAQFGTGFADFVFEEVGERFDEAFEIDDSRKAACDVMALVDGCIA